VLPGSTFVDVDTVKPIAVKSFRTVTGVSAVVVGASGARVALMLKVVALVDVDAHLAVAFVSCFAFALERAECVYAKGAVGGTVVFTGDTFVKVDAQMSIAFVSVFAGALEGADGVFAGGEGGTATVFLLKTFVFVVACISVAPEAVETFTLELGC
jgi:hypothetical protein